MRNVKYLIINILLIILLVSCRDESIIYESDEEINPADKIMIHEVKIADESKNKLTVEFTYTYENAIPAEEIKLYVMPDHGYWSTNPVKITKGKHSAKAYIGLSKSNMEKDNVTESTTKILRFRFDHYPPGKYAGNVWGVNVDYNKKWEQLKTE